MQISAAQLPSHLAKGLKGLYTVHGAEALLAQEAADAIRSAARAQGYTERSVFVIQGQKPPWDEVLAATQSQSLFGDKQIVEIRLPTGKPGKEGSALLQDLAQSAAENDGVLTLVHLPEVDWASRKTAWFAALEQYGVSVAVQPISRAELPRWLAARMAAAGLGVEPGLEGERTLTFFAECVEGNLLAAHQEVQKLALLYAAPEAHTIASPASAKTSITEAQLRASVFNMARFDISDVVSTAMAGGAASIKRLQTMLQSLQAAGEAAVPIHFMLAQEILTLSRLRQSLDAGQPLPLALKAARVWGDKERLYQRVLPSYSAAKSAKLLAAAHTADGIIKGIRAEGWPHDPWLALQRLGTMFAVACR